MRAVEPREMKLDQLAERCEDETELFFHPNPQRTVDPRYCFEIFRRALEGRDQLAWEAIYRQYCPLVAGWVARHPELAQSNGEIQEFVNGTFQRMWAAIPPAKFGRFGTLSSILAYLKMCVHSAIVEEARKAGALRRAVALDALPPEVEPVRHEGIDSPVDRLAFAGELRETLWNVVNARLRDDKERLVVHCLFELDLRPKNIVDRYPEMFRDAREVYTIRQVVLERLARDPALQTLVGEHA
jgi:DNA-directed RNA polymerase specialized sigma24 family protein